MILQGISTDIIIKFQLQRGKIPIMELFSCTIRWSQFAASSSDPWPGFVAWFCTLIGKFWRLLLLTQTKATHWFSFKEDAVACTSSQKSFNGRCLPTNYHRIPPHLKRVSKSSPTQIASKLPALDIVTVDFEILSWMIPIHPSGAQIPTDLLTKCLMQGDAMLIKSRG